MEYKNGDGKRNKNNADKTESISPMSFQIYYLFAQLGKNKPPNKKVNYKNG